MLGNVLNIKLCRGDREGWLLGAGIMSRRTLYVLEGPHQVEREHCSVQRRGKLAVSRS